MTHLLRMLAVQERAKPVMVRDLMRPRESSLHEGMVSEGLVSVAALGMVLGWMTRTVSLVPSVPSGGKTSTFW